MNPFEQLGAAATGVAILFFIIFTTMIFLISLTIAILYLLNLQNLMKEIDIKNREVEPTNVWLMLIPFFNLVYGFILLPKICNSVKKEFTQRGMEETGNYGSSLAIAIPILTLLFWFPFASLANLVLVIIFWVKMAEYKNKLRNNPKAIEPLTA